MRALEADAGSASPCAVSRSGASHPAAKYRDSAVSPVSAVRRTLTHTPTTEATAARVIAIRETWTVRSSGTLGAVQDWNAYDAEGIKALAQLAGHLRHGNAASTGSGRGGSRSPIELMRDRSTAWRQNRPVPAFPPLWAAFLRVAECLAPRGVSRREAA